MGLAAYFGHSHFPTTDAQRRYNLTCGAEAPQVKLIDKLVFLLSIDKESFLNKRIKPFLVRSCLRIMIIFKYTMRAVNCYKHALYKGHENAFNSMIIRPPFQLRYFLLGIEYQIFFQPFYFCMD